MKKVILTFLVCLTNSCAHTEHDLTLEKRADYVSLQPESLNLDAKKALGVSGTHQPERHVVSVYLFPHEVTPKEYFWGGWISVVLDGRSLEFIDEAAVVDTAQAKKGTL